MSKTVEIQNSGWMGDNDTFMHMQEGIVEFITNLHKGLMPASSQSSAMVVGYRLWGLAMTLSNTDLTLTWTAGAIYYNGKVLLVDAGTSTRTNASTQTWIFGESVTWGQSEYEYVGGPQLDTRKTVVGILTLGTGLYIGTRYDTPYLNEVVGGGKFSAPAMSNTDFTVDTGSWTVNPTNVARTATVALNKRVVWDLFVSASTTSGSPTELRVELPDGVTAERFATGIARLTGTGITGTELVLWNVFPSGQIVTIKRLDSSAFPASLGLTVQVSFIAE